MAKKKKMLITALSVVIVCTLTYFIFIKERKPRYKMPKNIVFLLFDAVRADATTPYGSPEDTTPFLNKLAERGVIFKNAYAQASMTLYSIASTFTGMYPAFHGLVTYQGYLRKDLLTLAEALRDNNYACFGFVNNPWLESGKYFNQGFNVYNLLKDNEVTRYALSILNPQNLNLIAIKNRNKFRSFTADREHTDIFSKINETDRYITGNGYKIVLRPGIEGRFEISKTVENLKPSQYFWGASVRAEEDCKAVFYLIAAGGDEKSQTTIAEREIEISKNWQSFQFKNKLENFKKISLAISFAKDTKGVQKIYVDDIFLLPARLAERQRNRFLYLHYLMPHSPHRIPKGYKHDPSLEAKVPVSDKRYISKSLGDPFFINNVKYLPQAPLFNKWKKYDDDILRHLTNYNHQIKYCDDQLKIIVGYLEKTGQLDDTLIIVTADHGEEFLEHGFLDHAFTSYVECLRVPLIMIYPACLPGKKVIEENAALIDIYPTIMELIRPKKETLETIKKQVQGKSLLPVIFGEKDISERIIYSTFFRVKQIAAFYKNWKLIDVDSKCIQRQMLFDLDKDPYETTPINEKYEKTLIKLSKAVQNYKESVKYLSKTQAKQISSNKTLLDNLARLGYIEIENQAKDDLSDIYCMYSYYSRFFYMILSKKLF